MFAYDGEGNPTTYSDATGPYTNATLSFDPEDRLTGIPSASFTAAYDGDGLRIKKTDPPIATTYFLYDGDGVPVVEEQMSGSSATLYALNVLGADGWRARSYVGSAFYAFSFDPEGNALSKQNSGNTLYNSYATSAFEAYGKRGAEYSVYTGANPPSHQDPVRFGGQYGYYTDYATGLVCLTHRYYDPGTGKFLTRDPIGYGGGVNLYGFCGGNPVNESDPSGEADVELRFKPEVLGAARHSYIVITDTDGTEYYFRGGPAGTNRGIGSTAPFGASSVTSSHSSAGSSSSGSSSGSSRAGSGGSSNGSSNSSNSSSTGSSRGGPGKNNGPYGPIHCDYGLYIPNTPDYTDSTEPSKLLIHDNLPASYYYNLFKIRADRLNRSQIPYNPFSTNSNSAASYILGGANLSNLQFL